MTDEQAPVRGSASGKDPLVLRTFDTALSAAGRAVDPLIESLRRRNPGADNDALWKKLDKYFISTVTSSGAATGAAAALPGVGTAAGVGLATGDTSFFFTAACSYVLAVSRLHGVQPTELEHQRALVLAVLVGGSGSAAVTRVAERTGQYWGRALAQSVPLSTIRSINKVLGPHFVTRYGSRAGILVLGKAAPFGIGAAIGAGGNLTFALMTIKSTRKAFGPLPNSSLHSDTK